MGVTVLLTEILPQPGWSLGGYAANKLAEKLLAIATTLTSYRAEIITLGIVLCAVVMMLTGDVGKWLGRCAFLFATGVVWALFK